MHLRKLINNDEAVSPVISVILMVAITVILAAVITVFVLGLGESTSDSGPQADFEFEYNDSDGNVTVRHANGDILDGDQLRFAGAANDKTSYGGITEWSGGEVQSGDTAVVDVKAGETLRVTWQSDDGTDTAVLDKYDVPNDAGASGSITSLHADSVNDEATVSVSSLDKVAGGDGYIVAENTDNGNTKESTISSGGSKTLDLTTVDDGQTVKATLYESSSKNNELDSATDTTASATITNLDTSQAAGDGDGTKETDGGEVIVDVSGSDVSNDQVWVVVEDESNFGTIDVDGHIDISGGSGSKSFTIDENKVANNEDITVTIYETNAESNNLDSQTKAAGGGN